LSFNMDRWLQGDRPQKTEPEKPRARYLETCEGYFIYHHELYGYSVACPSPYKLLAYHLETLDEARGVCLSAPPVPSLREQFMRRR